MTFLLITGILSSSFILLVCILGNTFLRIIFSIMSGTAMTSARMEGALALVIGSEGDGIGRLVKEKCDFLVSIPMFGQIDSLNAAVAAAVLMFEKRRQDGIRKN